MRKSRTFFRLLLQYTPTNRSITGSALAVTLTWSDDSGAITDSDILFNPSETFSTTLARILLTFSPSPRMSEFRRLVSWTRSGPVPGAAAHEFSEE